MRHEAARYVFVGLVSNILLYALYIGITKIGVGHKTAMTALFALGVLQTFYFNRRWTFASDSLFWTALRKYLLIYSCAWLANFFALMVLVDQLGFAHEIVQGIAVVVLAIALFLLQKFWVFRDRPEQLINNVDVSPAGRKF
jgi:putative flippase GtrA